MGRTWFLFLASILHVFSNNYFVSSNILAYTNSRSFHCSRYRYKQASFRKILLAEYIVLSSDPVGTKMSELRGKRSLNIVNIDNIRETHNLHYNASSLFWHP